MRCEHTTQRSRAKRQIDVTVQQVSHAEVFPLFLLSLAVLGPASIGRSEATKIILSSNS